MGEEFAGEWINVYMYGWIQKVKINFTELLAIKGENIWNILICIS